MAEPVAAISILPVTIRACWSEEVRDEINAGTCRIPDDMATGFLQEPLRPLAQRPHCHPHHPKARCMVHTRVVIPIFDTK
jgi:hypothetical protein